MSDLLRTARAIHELLDRERPGRWVILVALSLVGALFEMLGAIVIYLMMGLLASPETVRDAPLAGRFIDLIPGDDLTEQRLVVAVLVLAFFLLRGAILVARAYIEARLVTDAGIEIADRLLSGYLMMPYTFHTRRNTAELIRNAYTSTGQLQAAVMLPMAFVVGDLLVILGLAVIVLASEPLGGLLAVVFLGGVTVIIQRMVRPRLLAWSRRAQDAAVGGLQAIQQSLGGILDIKLLGQERTFLATHRFHRRRGARAVYLTQATGAIPRALIELGMVSAVVVLTVAILLSGASVDETLAAIGLFAYAGLRLQPVLQRIVTSVNQIRAGSAIVDDLAEDLTEIQAEMRRVGGPVPRPPETEDVPSFLALSPLHDALVLEDVRFTYAPDEPSVRPALRGVDLTVRRGEFLGICGPTGGGKSTLLDLMIGLLEPTAGVVRVDDRALDPAPAWWWAQLGVVSQQVFLTDDTLRRNIAFGVPDDAIDEERLARCVARAQLTELVERLTDGLDTLVGERGIRLSGGQRQRVAVARALYREPPVVVLDEGTSALDGATEAKLIAALDTIAPDRTLIAVAHRLATLRDADRILVVADGHDTDSGTYVELMGRSALFRDLAGAA